MQKKLFIFLTKPLYFYEYIYHSYTNEHKCYTISTHSCAIARKYFEYFILQSDIKYYFCIHFVFDPPNCPLIKPSLKSMISNKFFICLKLQKNFSSIFLDIFLYKCLKSKISNDF